MQKGFATRALQKGSSTRRICPAKGFSHKWIGLAKGFFQDMHKARHRKKMGLEVLPLQKHVGCHLVCVPWLKEARENTTSLGSHYLVQSLFFQLFFPALWGKSLFGSCARAPFSKSLGKGLLVPCERAQRYEQHKCHLQPKQEASLGRHANTTA